MSQKIRIVSGFCPSADEFHLGQDTNSDIYGKKVARMKFACHQPPPLLSPGGSPFYDAPQHLSEACKYPVSSERGKQE